MLKVTEKVPLSMGNSVFLCRLIFQTDTQEREPFAVCSSVGGSFLGFSRCPLSHYNFPLIKRTDMEVPSCLTEV